MPQIESRADSPALTVGTSAADSTGRPWFEAEIAKRREFALAMGGPDKIERQHARGRLTARERVERLVDEGSWREIGMMTGSARYDERGQLISVESSNVVCGQAKIGGRDVIVVAEDFTVRGGSSEATNPEKWQYVERLALTYRWPVIRLVETAGGSVNLLEQMSATKIPGYPHWPMVELLGTVPVVGVALGAAAGLGAVRVCASHLSIMTAEGSYLFAGGPAVVKKAVGEDVTNAELGGSGVHARGSGVVDNEAADEFEALEQVVRFLSYLPSSVHELPPVTPCADPVDRRDEALSTTIPAIKQYSYDMRELLASVFDDGSLFEIGRYFGQSQITMLARLDGHAVAVLANDPRWLGGSLTVDSAEKITRFVDMADTFHLPVVNLIDQPGTFVGSDAEQKGTLRKGIRAAMALEQASVPWLSLFVRRAYGLAGAAYGPVGGGSINRRLAWPTAHWGSIPIEGGVEAAYRRTLAESDDPDTLRKELYARFQPVENPFRTAERFGIQDIIDPRDTRPMLCEWVRQAYRILPEHLGTTARTMRA
ncbi:carboxyl transferase domain-containing protein [Saccharopolyspora shandongensis]|uniref:acyl-CoA carboxylase subunit beta n=1 Tax=Saccharopolyspora shandongensis TaxID=418495 RepID=UPI0033F6EF01